MVFHAHACKELKARREPIAIIRYQDSSALSENLSVNFIDDGHHLPIDDGSPARKRPESPFKGLYVIQGRPPKADSLLDCNIGVESPRYAQLAREGIFVKIRIKDIVKAKGKPLTWDEVRVFMDLGMKLETPESIDALKKMLEKDSIRIDAEFPVRHGIRPDPWFGVFYKKTTLKSYLYGIKFDIRNDTLTYAYHEPYFGFGRTYIGQDWLDGASGVYVPNTPEYRNERKLDAFIGKSYGK